MKKFSLFLMLIISLNLFLLYNFNPVKAQEDTIYIREDGTVEGTDKLVKEGSLNKFVLLDNIVGKSIIIERRMGTFDGNGFIIQGSGNGTGLFLNDRGTIQNVTVKGFSTGIFVFGDNFKVANCFVTGNSIGLNTKQNTTRIKNGIITGNNITENNLGLRIEMGSEGETNLIVSGNSFTKNKLSLYFTLNFATYTLDNNGFDLDVQIYKNNFINNNKTVDYGLYYFPFLPGASNHYINIWDNGLEGNYWSFYNQTDNNNDGIIDTPYDLGGGNIDSFPLVHPVMVVAIPEFPSFDLISILAGLSLVVLIVRKKRGVLNEKK